MKQRTPFRLEPIALLYLFQVFLLTAALPPLPQARSLADRFSTPPANPVPSDKSSTHAPWQGLKWDKEPGISSYDVFLWKAEAGAPQVPTAVSPVNLYLPRSYLAYGATYRWRIVALPAGGQSVAGPTWTFTTRSRDAGAVPPFDISPNAQEARRATYALDGLKRIRAAGTPLRSGMRIGFYGDSNTDVIQWQKELADSLYKSGAISLNRGINGADVAGLRQGIRKYNAGGGLPVPKPFALQLLDDMPDIAVFYIGINDVLNNNPTTPKAVFKEHIQAMVDSALALKVTVVLVTPAMYNEKPDGSNIHDRQLDEYAQACQEVALSRKVALVNARRLFLDYLKNNNFAVQDDGTVIFPRSVGVVNYDVVHHNDTGKHLLSDWVADGILRAFGIHPVPVRGPGPARVSHGIPDPAHSTAWIWRDVSRNAAGRAHRPLPSGRIPQAKVSR